MVLDLNNDVYISGYYHDTGSVKGSLLVKFSASGVFQWLASIDSTHYFNQVAVDDSNNVYITGTSYTNHTIIYLRKYNSSGNLLWQRLYGTGLTNFSRSIMVDDSGYIYVSGQTSSSFFTTLKFDWFGNAKWAAIDTMANGTGNGNSYVVVDRNYNVYYAGRSYDSTLKSTLIKYDINGVKQWETSFCGDSNSVHSAPSGLRYDDHGFIYMLASKANGNGVDDFEVIKYDTSGSLIWRAGSGLTSFRHDPKALAIDKAGNAYVIENLDPGSGNSSYRTIRYDSSGNLKWARIYSASIAWNIPKDIELDSSGSIYVTGLSQDTLYRNGIATIKYDSSGNEVWIARFNNTVISDDEAKSLSIDRAGNILVAGAADLQTASTIEVIKYSAFTGLNEPFLEPPKIVIFPNPNSGNFTLNINRDLVNAQFELFDLTGRSILKVKDLIGKSIIVSDHRFATGIYYYYLTQNNSASAHGKIAIQN